MQTYPSFVQDLQQRNKTLYAVTILDTASDANSDSDSYLILDLFDRLDYATHKAGRRAQMEKGHAYTTITVSANTLHPDIILGTYKSFPPWGFRK